MSRRPQSSLLSLPYPVVHLMYRMSSHSQIDSTGPLRPPTPKVPQRGASAFLTVACFFGPILGSSLTRHSGYILSRSGRERLQSKKPEFLSLPPFKVGIQEPRCRLYSRPKRLVSSPSAASLNPSWRFPRNAFPTTIEICQGPQYLHTL